MPLTELVRSAEVTAASLAGASIGSVVPGVTGALAEACERWLGAPVTQIDARSTLPITLDVEEPLPVGADRIINSLAASRMCRSDCIVVDLGTATTYDCITAAGLFLGGVIAPGSRLGRHTRRSREAPGHGARAPSRTSARTGFIRAGDAWRRRLDRRPCGINEMPTRAPSRWLRPAARRVLAPLCTDIDLVDRT